MTINNDLARVQYNGNGVTTAFPFGTRVLEASHLRVLRQDLTTGAVTELVLDSIGADGFTVTGVGGDACTVNTVTAPTADERLTIVRNVPLTQTADYVPNDPFPASTHENALDKLTMQQQEQRDALDRSAKLPETSTVGLNVILPQTPVNNRAIKWDGTTGAMKNSDNDPDQLVADVSGLVDTATNAASTATTQAGNSSASATLSQQYAQGVPSEPAGFSAKYWRDQAAAFAPPANNWTATTDPTVNDDITQGYAKGSKWYNAVTQEAFMCVDNTAGSAVWVWTTLTADDLGSAAFNDTGTNIGDVVQLEDVGGNAALPSVDGSQITGFNKIVGMTYVENRTLVSLPTSSPIPLDNTVPDITEGVEVLSASHTAKSVSNKLKIDVIIPTGCAGTANYAVALFAGSTCIAAVQDTTRTNTTASVTPVTVVIDPPSTSAVTYSVRVGYSSANGALNSGIPGVASLVFGGASVATMVITEIS